MNLDNLPSNSYSSKEKLEEIQQEQPIITGEVNTRKISPIKRLLRNLISEDLPDMKSYAWYEVFLPLFRDGLSDLFETFLYGDARYASSRRSRGGPRTGETRISYQSYSTPTRANRSRGEAKTYSLVKDIDELLFNSRGDAEIVLEQMDKYISDYGQVSVAVVYQWINKPHQYTDRYRGWDSLDNCRIERVRAGGQRMYCLKLPRCKELD